MTESKWYKTRYFAIFCENNQTGNYCPIDYRFHVHGQGDNNYPKNLAVIIGVNTLAPEAEFTRIMGDRVLKDLRIGYALRNKFAYESDNLQDCIDYARALYSTPYMRSGQLLTECRK